MCRDGKFCDTVTIAREQRDSSTITMNECSSGSQRTERRHEVRYLQDLEEQKRTKYKINGTATTAIEKSNPNLPAKSMKFVTRTLLVLVRVHVARVSSYGYEYEYCTVIWWIFPLLFLCTFPIYSM